MTDEMLIALSRHMEHDLADAIPDVVMLRDLCALAGQLRISQIVTEADGCSVSQAQGFVVEADRLSLGIEHLGARVAGSCLADVARQAQDFADGLLDIMVMRSA